MAGRPWTDGDRAAVRAEYGRTPTPELAARLGRSVGAVCQLARELGAARKWALVRDSEFVSRCAELHGRGLTNEGIARELRCNKVTVRRALAARGLVSLGRRAPSYREQARAKALDRIARGAPGPEQYRRDRLRSTKYGLPHMSDVKLKIVFALLTGPKSRREIAAALGVKWTVSRKLLKSHHNGSHTGDLIRAGLIAETWHTRGPGKGNRHRLYSLTPHCLDLLSQGAAK